jgi:hypothetical protein
MITEDHMFERLLVSSLLGASLLVAGCSDDVKRVGNDHSGDNIDATYNVGDISGIWDLTGSVGEGGDSVTGTLAINRDVFWLELAGYSRGWGNVFIDYSKAEPQSLRAGTTKSNLYSVTREQPIDLSLGVIPSDTGGEWTMGESFGYTDCRAMVTADSIRGACGGPWGTRDAFGRDRSFGAQRVGSARSIFGEIGGTWNVGLGEGQGGGCTAVLRDTTFTASCSGTSSARDGRLTFTLREGHGSGSSEEGLEISALRR